MTDLLIRLAIVVVVGVVVLVVTDMLGRARKESGARAGGVEALHVHDARAKQSPEREPLSPL